MNAATDDALCPRANADAPAASRRARRAAVLGWHYTCLNATCLIQASFVLRVFRSAQDHNHSNYLLYKLQGLKNTCFKQVVLDKWVPPEMIRYVLTLI